MQKWPAVWRGEGLAGRDALWIDAFRHALALEQERHLASIGILARRSVVPESDPNSGRFILPLGLWRSGSALESHSRGQGFESPQVHTHNIWYPSTRAPGFAVQREFGAAYFALSEGVTDRVTIRIGCSRFLDATNKRARRKQLIPEPVALTTRIRPESVPLYANSV